MKDGILIIGRFSGFHRGHLEIIRKANIDHPEKPIIIAVVVGKKSSKDLEKNPFSFQERKEMIIKILKKLNIKAAIIQVPTAYIPDLVEILRTENNINIKYIYCGADRLNSYLKQNLEDLGIKVVYLDRNESNLDPTKRASATKLRNAIKNKDYEEFKNLMPDEIDSDSLIEIWNKLREAMISKGIEVKASGIQSGIVHIEDLDVEEFIDWVENFYNEKIMAVQKLDGTFNMSILKNEDGINLARLSKGQTEPFTADDLPKNPIYNALRGACYTLENPEIEEIFDKYLNIGDAVDIEVLYGDQPNSIRYNLENNYLALLRFISGKTGEEAEKILDDLSEQLKQLEIIVNNTVYFYDWENEKLDSEIQKEVWKFTKPEVLDKLNNKLDFTEDLEKLEKWLTEKNKIIPELYNLEVMGIKLNTIKLKNRPKYKEAREQALQEANKFKLNIKNKMIEKIFKNANFEIGGTNQEGLVLRNLETGKMTKLVDKETFTKENKNNWYYMELATKGVKIDGEYIPGIISKYFDFCASTLNIPMLRVHEKLWKSLKNGSYDIKTNIKNYIISNEIEVYNLNEKLVLMKREAINSINKLYDLKDKVLNDSNLTDTVRNRTLNSFGLINDNFKNLINDINSLINSTTNNKEEDNYNQFVESIYILLKNFSK